MLPVSISLTLALLAHSSGHPAASPGTSSPRGVLDRLLSRVDRGRLRPSGAAPPIPPGGLPLMT
jgi:hypothetical protein